MKIIFLLPIIIQAVLMAIDEFLFHRKRVLPRWERVGHPLDTLSFVVPILILVLNLSSEAYFVFSFISCLIITKDEFVHSQVCHGGEQWLHSMLFILHPVTFYSLFKLKGISGNLVIYSILFSTISFFIYQISYWRPWWDQKKLLTMKSMNN